MKALNYKIGALKRKFKMGKGEFAPGALINKVQAQKAAPVEKSVALSKEKVAIMGLV